MKNPLRRCLRNRYGRNLQFQRFRTVKGKAATFQTKQVLLLKNNQLQGGRCNSALSLHPIVDYFPPTAYTVIFYSSLIKQYLGYMK